MRSFVFAIIVTLSSAISLSVKAAVSAERLVAAFVQIEQAEAGSPLQHVIASPGQGPADLCYALSLPDYFALLAGRTGQPAFGRNATPLTRNAFSQWPCAASLPRAAWPLAVADFVWISWFAAQIERPLLLLETGRGKEELCAVLFTADQSVYQKIDWPWLQANSAALSRAIVLFKTDDIWSVLFTASSAPLPVHSVIDRFTQLIEADVEQPPSLFFAANGTEEKSQPVWKSAFADGASFLQSPEGSGIGQQVQLTLQNRFLPVQSSGKRSQNGADHGREQSAVGGADRDPDSEMREYLSSVGEQLKQRYQKNAQQSAYMRRSGAQEYKVARWECLAYLREHDPQLYRVLSQLKAILFDHVSTPPSQQDMTALIREMYERYSAFVAKASALQTVASIAQALERLVRALEGHPVLILHSSNNLTWADILTTCMRLQGFLDLAKAESKSPASLLPVPGEESRALFFDARASELLGGIEAALDHSGVALITALEPYRPVLHQLLLLLRAHAHFLTASDYPPLFEHLSTVLESHANAIRAAENLFYPEQALMDRFIDTMLDNSVEKDILAGLGGLTVSDMAFFDRTKRAMANAFTEDRFALAQTFVGPDFFPTVLNACLQSGALRSIAGSPLRAAIEQPLPGTCRLGGEGRELSVCHRNKELSVAALTRWRDTTALSKTIADVSDVSFFVHKDRCHMILPGRAMAVPVHSSGLMRACLEEKSCSTIELARSSATMREFHCRLRAFRSRHAVMPVQLQQKRHQHRAALEQTGAADCASLEGIKTVTQSTAAVQALTCRPWQQLIATPEPGRTLTAAIASKPPAS